MRTVIFLSVDSMEELKRTLPVCWEDMTAREVLAQEFPECRMTVVADGRCRRSLRLGACFCTVYELREPVTGVSKSFHPVKARLVEIP